jgi:hypothetical protein
MDLKRVPWPRLLTWIVVAFAFAFSFVVLTHSSIFGQFRATLATIAAASGLNVGPDALLALFCAALLAIGLFSEKRLRLAIVVSWLMLFPSLLYFSRIDWAYILRLPFDNRVFSNDLDPALVFLCGVALLMASLVLRSRMHLVSVQENLRSRMAPEDDISDAVDSNFRFLLLMTASSAAAGVILFLGASVLWPLIANATSGWQYAYLAIGVAGLAGLVIAFGLYVWWRGWRKERPAGHGRER